MNKVCLSQKQKQKHVLTNISSIKLSTITLYQIVIIQYINRFETS